MPASLSFARVEGADRQYVQDSYYAAYLENLGPGERPYRSRQEIMAEIGPFLEPAGAGLVSRLLRRPSSVPHAAMVVKDEVGRRVGCLVLRVGPDETGRTAWVYLIYVERDRRRQGHGRRMLAWAEEWGRANGAGHLMLNVRASNEAAMNLYESSGMSPYQIWMRKGL